MASNSGSGTMPDGPKVRSQHAGNSIRTRLAPYVCGAMVVVMHLAFYTMFVPIVRLIELAVCREHYAIQDPTVIGPDGFVDESRCKVDSIQWKLAWLMTLNQLLSYAGDFIATLPLSLLADQIGPRPVLILNFSGQILSWSSILCVCYFYDTFSSDMVLISCVFTSIGGATHLSTALIWGEAAFFTKNRTTTFSVYEALEYVSQLIGPIVGSYLMTYKLSAPFCFAIPLSLTSIPLTLYLPAGPRSRFRNKASSESINTGEQQGLLSPRFDDSQEPLPSDISTESPCIYMPKPKVPYLRSRLLAFQNQIREFGKMFARFRMVKSACVAQLVSKLGKQVFHILPQYISKRFAVPIAQVGYLFSIKTVVIILLYCVILPFGQHIISPQANLANIWLARHSIILLMLGSAMMGVAWNVFALIPGLVVFALGSGFPVIVKSIATSSANANNLSVPLLYSGLAYAETFGSFIGATAVTAVFTSTLHLGGTAAGVPFLVSMVSYALVAIPTWLLEFAEEL